MAALINFGERVAIGNDSGWALRFDSGGEPPLIVTSATVNGSIEATLPRGLSGGTYAFQLEGIADEDHRRIAASDTRREGDELRLYLFWRDANATAAGYLASVTGVADVLASLSSSTPDAALVAVLTVTLVARGRSGGRYVTDIQARERVHTRLERANVVDKLTQDDLVAAAAALGRQAHIEVKPHAKQPAGRATSGAVVTPAVGTSALAAMAGLARRIEESTKQYGRGTLLIRDGELHVGPRPIPLTGTPKTLDLESGLIEVIRGKRLSTGRRRYTLTLKGRPDLKPGDVVIFEAPPEDPPESSAPSSRGPLSVLTAEATAVLGTVLGVFGVSAGATVKLYVAAVQHKLDRRNGFRTVVSGITLGVGDNDWDDRAAESDVDGGGDAATAVGERVVGAADRALRTLAQPEVAEVTRVLTSGTAEPPGQTLTIMRGLTASDGQAHASRRLAVNGETPDEVEGVSYLTPFAWGRCGLVLPRYPGMRVAVMHRGARAEDPLEVGALWPSGSGPQNAQEGDWWLVLPVGAAGGQTTTPKTAVNDLIDADGNRVIEMGELTVRVGRGNTLHGPGERPKRGATDAVSIVHAAKGSSIVMNADGSVVIDAKAGLTLQAADDIVMKANNVRVHLPAQGSMDVS